VPMLSTPFSRDDIVISTTRKVSIIRMQSMKHRSSSSAARASQLRMMNFFYGARFTPMILPSKA
jgi:hypothetical protein